MIFLMGKLLVRRVLVFDFCSVYKDWHRILGRYQDMNARKGIVSKPAKEARPHAVGVAVTVQSLTVSV